MPDNAAIKAIKENDPGGARQILTKILKANPNDDKAWLLLAGCTTKPEQKRECLQRALAIRPENQDIHSALEELESDIEAPSQTQESGPDTPRRKGKSRKRPPKRKSSGRLAFFQACLVVFLFLIILAALGALGYMLLQDGTLSLTQAAAPTTAPAAPMENAPAATIDLPPTWTWTAPPPATNTLTPTTIPPTRTPTETPLPLHSITPYSLHWRLVIGYSVEGRPLEVHRFGTGREERMIVAGIHGGNEWNTIALADELIAYLQEHPETVPTENSLYILRSLNPDGEARGRSADGRTNSNGVDLNRNFEINWKAKWDIEGCWSQRPVTAGSGPNSEPETQALEQFLRSRNVAALISYHSARLGIFPGGEPPDPASQSLAESIAGISNYAYPPVDTGCEFSGTLADWAVAQGIAAVDLELTTHSDTDFEVNLEILKLLLNWAP